MNREMLRKIVDKAFNEATESQTVPSTEWADRIIDSVMLTLDEQIIKYLEERLAAHEGGAPAINIQYDDATFCYIISQKEGFGDYKNPKTLGCSKSLTRAFNLAILGKVYD